MRRKDREVTDINEIKQILKDSHVIHSGFRTDDYPYVVPTNFAYEFDGDNHLTLYIHGAPEGTKRELIKKDGRMGFEIDDGGQLMVPKDPKENTPSFAYRSVMGYGDAELVDDPETKKHALQLLLGHETGQKLADFDVSEKTIEYVGVIKITVKSYTAKAHGGDDPEFK
ncbi:pyridoxamine 5'-phosphate oxidase family protein [Lentilactobacillus kefiri]|uniref:5-nitroimidazole antibiotic resistance n=2 Tax=Lentilactobacillus kefiri TaxID=33962 RepID=A0A8E1RI06_LENKE|nr:pyridoxamine 5'-phosphate oxidase family protein [Lentilactobacillus kefiri]KRL73448.1 5-nitroimidazole antibiotic resistance [Lentilactobacillus parakefiri DSM 10551]KRM49693.1 5-nitroimidazole antibiotic resistance [Lentilactobacillus kefiri DSM 20587 = JCM 5818]MCJ2162483.1 pyridoxamine 5'-phosphate oxidase family protein [Lentilactobacillus kefiri]MCP9369713.1 pyridoxamine 5'-phosphate oxidase family protein [Lentilactobacillus kefiri]MDH5109421.1 pyridoxamine 5'-phosphate oxidase famil